MNILRNLFDFEREHTAGEVVFFKLFELFVAGAFVSLAWDWGMYTLRITEAVAPQGIGRYVDVGFMYGGSAPVVVAAAATLLLGLGYFRLWRYAYACALPLLHLLFVARFALGKLPHSSNMLGMTLLGLALAMVCFADDRSRRRFTLGFTYFFVGLGYVLAGASKLVGTGLNWADGRHLRLWIHEKSIDTLARAGAFELNTLQELALASRPAATLFLVTGLIVELSAFLVWWRRTRRAALTALIGLHAGIFLVMNIQFTLSVWELVLLALPWSTWLDRLLRETTWTNPLEQFSIRFA